MPTALIIDDHPIVLQGCIETIKAHGAGAPTSSSSTCPSGTTPSPA